MSLTANDYANEIARAIREQNVLVIPGLLKLMSIEHPEEAAVLLDKMRLVLEALGK